MKPQHIVRTIPVKRVFPYEGEASCWYWASHDGSLTFSEDSEYGYRCDQTEDYYVLDWGRETMLLNLDAYPEEV